MGFIRKWIQALSVPVDEETGAIRVKADLAATPDIDIGDIHLLDVAGEKVNPATKEAVDAVVAALADRATETTVASIRAAVTNGLPAMGTDAAGEDTYATVVTAPARECHRVVIQLDAGEDAIVSFDGGVTDHLYVKAGNNYALDGLVIAAGAVIQGRNAVGGSNYTNLRISVW